MTIGLAVALIIQVEGIETDAYLNPVGVPTICTGMTSYPNGDPVRMGDVCNKTVCTGYTESMLKQEVIPAVSKIPGWNRFGARRQSALLSFAWNVGADFYQAEGFESITTVLEEGAEHPEAYEDMADVLGGYTKVNGEELPGLVKRRSIEGFEWDQESVKPLFLKSSQDTFLKKAPIGSMELSDQGKRRVWSDEEIIVVRVEEIPHDAHSWVTFFNSGEKWIIYGPHWREKTANEFIPKYSESINWCVAADRVSKYLTVGEILQYDPRRAPLPGSKAEKKIKEIAKEFDAIREAWGGPLGVASGYRPEPINRQVGGASNSYHVKGMALDIYPINNVDDPTDESDDMEYFHRWLVQRWSGGYGDGREKGFIHIDTRKRGGFRKKPGVKPAVLWTY